MRIKDWLDVFGMGVITFWHIVILHHDMESDESVNSMAVSCSCGYYRIWLN